MGYDKCIIYIEVVVNDAYFYIINGTEFKAGELR